MISFEDALNLKPGDIIRELNSYNRDGSMSRWRVNGKVKTWKTMPDRIKIPIKHGLRTCDYLTEKDLSYFTLKGK